MNVLDRSRQHPRAALVPHSPLRQVDPRTKLALSVCASLTVMLPLPRMVIFFAIYALFLLAVRLFKVAAQQVWRLKWLLVALFVMDWLFIGLDLAVVITFRVALLATVFALFVSTTTPEEFRLALERLRVPYRYAFSLSLAFQSVELMRAEWRGIREAQVARLGRSGAGPLIGDDESRSWRMFQRLWRTSVLRDLVVLTVPAIVLTTRRAWSMTEAAYARGFESPHRRPYRALRMRIGDWLLIVGVVGLVALLILV